MNKPLKSLLRFASTSDPDKVRKSLLYCQNQLKTTDIQSYYIGLSLPKHLQDAYFPVRLLNAELAGVREIANNPTLASVRLAWWKQTFLEEASKGRAPPHPMGEAITHLLRERKLPKRYFERIISARQDDASGQTWKTLEDMMTYGENVYASQNYLMLEAAGVRDLHADHVASHMGRCLSTVITLRAVGHHALRRRCYLPTVLMAEHKLSEERLFRFAAAIDYHAREKSKQSKSAAAQSGQEHQHGPECQHNHVHGPECSHGHHHHHHQHSPIVPDLADFEKENAALRSIVFTIANHAKSYLDSSRVMAKDIPKETHPLFRHSIVCDIFLTQLEKHEFDIFHPKLGSSFTQLPFLWNLIKRHYVTGGF